MKPTAGKYDFKDKIADLQAMICPLKNALSDQRLKAIALAEAVALASEEGRSSVPSMWWIVVEAVTISLEPVAKALAAAEQEVSAKWTSQPTYVLWA